MGKAQQVERGEADFALAVASRLRSKERASVVYKHAYESDFLLVTPPKHPLARVERLRLEDVAKHPLVVGTPDTSTRQRIDEVFRLHGLENKVTVAVESNSSVITFACVRSGIGVGITVSPERGRLMKGLKVRSMARWLGKAEFLFVWRRGGQVLPVQRELADLIRSCVG